MNHLSLCSVFLSPLSVCLCGFCELLSRTSPADPLSVSLRRRQSSGQLSLLSGSSASDCHLSFRLPWLKAPFPATHAIPWAGPQTTVVARWISLTVSFGTWVAHWFSALLTFGCLWPQSFICCKAGLRMVSVICASGPCLKLTPLGLNTLKCLKPTTCHSVSKWEPGLSFSVPRLSLAFLWLYHSVLILGYQC